MKKMEIMPFTDDASMDFLEKGSKDCVLGQIAWK